jgi:hypothetical protein
MDTKTLISEIEAKLMQLKKLNRVVAARRIATVIKSLKGGK